MRPHRTFIRALGAFGAAALVLPETAAAVTDEEFNALKALVAQQGREIEQLQKTHGQDQQELQRLKQQMAGTQPVPTNATPLAESTAPMQPVAAPPTTPERTHNFLMAGDAEV